MTAIALPRKRVLADAIAVSGKASLVRDAVLVLAGTGLVALSAQASIPLPMPTKVMPRTSQACRNLIELSTKSRHVPSSSSGPGM